MIVSSLLALLLGTAEAKAIDFYVAPIRVHNRTELKAIEDVIDEQLAFVISSGYSRTFRAQTQRGSFVPGPMEYDSIRVFNKKTIEYYNDCDYILDPMKCTFENENYFVETIVTVDDNQLTVRMTMYDPNLQVVNSSIATEEMTVNWIKQQEVTNVQSTARDGTKTEMTHYGLERMPLKWEIPHHLLEKHIREAASELWLGARIRL
jgi:hypothetical protein